MKKTFALAVLSLLVYALFAWNVGYYVDDFGDKTEDKYLISDRILIEYGGYSWEKEYCQIIMDEDSVGFRVGETFYKDWTMKTKMADGTVHTFLCQLKNNGIIYIDDNAFPYKRSTTFILDLLEGCRVILSPNNQYAKDKYDFGTMKIEPQDVDIIHPEWGLTEHEDKGEN